MSCETANGGAKSASRSSFHELLRLLEVEHQREIQERVEATLRQVSSSQKRNIISLDTGQQKVNEEEGPYSMISGGSSTLSQDNGVRDGQPQTVVLTQGATLSEMVSEYSALDLNIGGAHPKKGGGSPEAPGSPLQPKTITWNLGGHSSPGGSAAAGKASDTQSTSTSQPSVVSKGSHMDETWSANLDTVLYDQLIQVGSRVQAQAEPDSEVFYSGEVVRLPNAGDKLYYIQCDDDEQGVLLKTSLVHLDEHTLDDAVVQDKMRNLLTQGGGRPSYDKKFSSSASRSFQRTKTLRSSDVDTKSRMILRPAGKPKLVWDLVGGAFLMKDLTLIPLQTFFAGSPKFAENFTIWDRYFEVVATVFWTVDIFITIITGYYTSEGFLELRIDHIVKRYAKTWLPLDLTLVCTDWISFALGMMNNLGFLRIGKTVARFMRILKILRFRKLNAMAKDMLERVNSEYVVTVIGVCKILLIIIIMNHYVACGWYGMTLLNIHERTWLDRIEEDFKVNVDSQESMTYLYATSLHWSLTQFTPASMEVVPQNAGERFYNVVIIIMGVVAFSSLVSSITGAMTYVRIINRKVSDTNSSLRKFFSENDIPQSLASRIWHFQQHVQRNKQKTFEMDKAIFHTLPMDIKHEVNCELYLTKLTVHPAFANLKEVDAEAITTVCASALEIKKFQDVQGHLNKGKAIEYMFFVLDGMLEYATTTSKLKGAQQDSGAISASVEPCRRISRKLTDAATPPGGTGPALRTSLTVMTSLGVNPGSPVNLQAGSWACEAALWLAHVKLPGTFNADAEKPQLLTVSAKHFREIAKQYPLALLFLSKYARKFCETMVSPSKRRVIPVICNDSHLGVIQGLVQEAFEELRTSIDEVQAKLL